MLTAILILALSCEPELTADEARLRDASEAYKAKLLAMIEDDIERLKLDLKAGRASRKSFSDSLRDRKRQLRELKKAGFIVPRLYLWNMQVEDIGQLTGGATSDDDDDDGRDWFRVFQIVDGENMLIELEAGNTANEVQRGVFHDDVLVWVRGVKTSNLRDDAFVKLSHIFKVTGNQTYRTPLGSTKSVLVIEPFAIQDTADIESKLHTDKRR